jgi:pimeloyl-ACP methyl ester carboxylesterase
VFYVGLGFAVFAVVLAAGVLYQILGSVSDARRFPAPGRLLDLGGHKLHLYERGSGSPTVILESGISASSLNWRRVQDAVAQFARVCSYDRAGLGWSELCDQPCTPESLARQLHTLLQAAEIPPPYILVGHSFGALVARAFANTYADEVSGVILVDPLDPREWTPLTDQKRGIIAHGVKLSRRGAIVARLGLVRLCLSLLLAGNRLLPRAAAKTWSGRAAQIIDRIASQVGKMPQETWPLVAAHWKQPKSFESMARHFECLGQSIREMENARPLAIPATMLVGKQNEHLADPLQHAKRISADTRVIFAENSGHWIQLDEPELVVESIRETVENARRKQSALVR